MEIKVRMIKENKDGSALAEVDFDKKGWETLVQWGLVATMQSAKYQTLAGSISAGSTRDNMPLIISMAKASLRSLSFINAPVSLCF